MLQVAPGNVMVKVGATSVKPCASVVSIVHSCEKEHLEIILSVQLNRGSQSWRQELGQTLRHALHHCIGT